jgi:metal-responsive CopG/Arc/MetJ family transcriptional regulator
VRLPAGLVESIDEWAAKTLISRSEAIRQVLERGFATLTSGSKRSRGNP